MAGGFGSTELESPFIGSRRSIGRGKRLRRLPSAIPISHLALTQIYAARAYFHASRHEIEAELATDDAEYDELKQVSVNSLTA